MNNPELIHSEFIPHLKAKLELTAWEISSNGIVWYKCVVYLDSEPLSQTSPRENILDAISDGISTFEQLRRTL
jgi:hypothetical protein